MNAMLVFSFNKFNYYDFTNYNNFQINFVPNEPYPCDYRDISFLVVPLGFYVNRPLVRYLLFSGLTARSLSCEPCFCHIVKEIPYITFALCGGLGCAIFVVFFIRKNSTFTTSVPMWCTICKTTIVKLG